MNGAELRAWRERLGLTREDASRAIGNALTRRESINAETVERLEGNRTFYGDPAPYVAAYRAALEAEEARQAEPVCPEGVYTTERHDPSRGPETVIRWSSEETELFVGYRETEDDVKAARFYLELVTYRARQRAEGDRQRKLDAVRAAEEAYLKAEDERRRAEDAADQAARALGAARREAGL